MAHSDSTSELPRASSASILEKRSLVLLEESLPADRFRFRRETESDVGVDGSIELLAAGHHTNLRAYVQVKATEHPKTNKDKSLSLRVDTSNLNYLLNAHCGLYVLCTFPDKQLRYTWAEDVRDDLGKRQPDWRQQASITIRFRCLLDNAALNEIEERLRRIGTIQRELAEKLARLGTEETVRVEINTGSLSIRDPNDAERLLLDSGLTVVTSGYAKEVIHLVSLLDPERQRAARVRLVHAYARYTQGRYGLALEHLRELVDPSDLGPADGRFLSYLRLITRRAAGRIGPQEYDDQIATLKQNDPVMSLECDFQDAVERVAHAGDHTDRVGCITSLEKIVGRIKSCDECSEELKLRASMWLCMHQGCRAATELQIGFAHLQMEQRLPIAAHPGSGKAEMERCSSALKQWERESQSLIKAAEERMNPVLLAEAMYLHIRGHLFHLGQSYLCAATSRTGTKDIGDRAKALIPMAQEVVACYRKADVLEAMLQCQLLLADLHRLAREGASAREIATKVRPVAEAMEYARILRQADEHLRGTDSISELLKEAQLLSKGYPDTKMASLTPREVEEMARTFLNLQGLPAERLPRLISAVECDSTFSRLRIEFCRYLEMREHLGHVRQQETYYKEEPLRVCVCVLRRYESAFPALDWRSMIQKFRSTYCALCADREPAGRENGTSNN